MQLSCLNVVLILALMIIALNSALLGTSAARSSAGDDISPIFRRKPYKSSTTESSKKITSIAELVTESTVSSKSKKSSSEESNKSTKNNNFRVGAEHYYDNRIDIQKQNDDLDIIIEEDIDDEGTNQSSEYADDTEYSEGEVDDDQYYYEDYVEGDPVDPQDYDHGDHDHHHVGVDQFHHHRPKNFDELEQQKYKHQRLQRLKLMQQRRRMWLERQRQRYYASMSKWRRKRPRVIISEVQKRPIKKRPVEKPLDSNRRHYEALRGRDHDSGESTSLMRSLLGVQPFCIHDEAQFSCTFTPFCWMQGGVAMNGCDSMLYSCCVSHTIARRQDTFVGTGRAQKRVDKDILHNEPECGITRHRQFAKRIIGGQKSKFAELPWQVHIRISSYQCGGVLLNHQYVATAAHCVHQAKLSQITVHLGEFDTKNTKKVHEPLGSESFRVEHITLHPDFRYMLTQPDRFDVAVLKLDHPVEYQDNILPICLPTSDYDLVGKVGVVAGWGKTDNSFGKTGTNILHKVLVPIIENTRCRSWHRDKAIQVQLHDEMFCAGHKVGKQDACLGDSGGPLVINFDGRWTLIGITSAGFGCAVEKQPGIYHKVSKTAKWLSQQINRLDNPK